MDADTWKSIEFHFAKALELDDVQRKAYLETLAQTAPDLHEQVENLLHAHFTSGMFLEEPITDALSVPESGMLGPWKLIRQIGRGGTSTVFLAERADGRFERNVAIKFLHGLMPGADTTARLYAEQRILARLEHPNIAQLIDAGISEDGRPYFILEYVDGLSLTEWCNTYKLPISARLALFEQVCEAVQFAHRRLVVHRDLKPSNILVDSSGTVKLLDFGIAKLLEADDPDAPVTREGQRLMTPVYASPEQITGDEITTANDVYSLGLLLCELLSGSLPYPVAGKNPVEITSVILNTEPQRPSVIVAQHVGNMDQLPGEGSIRQLSRKLEGDLDTIVLKALRKEPERRYGSAEELLADIQRFRNDLPILARPEKISYRLGKFVKRYRYGVVAAVFMITALVAAAVISLQLAHRATLERQKAEQVNVVLQNMLASPNPYEDGREVKVIEVLDRTAEFLDTDFTGQPEVEGAVRQTLGVTYRELGLYDSAMEQLQKALAVRMQVSGHHHQDVAETQGALALLEQKRGNLTKADSLFRLALETNRRVFGEPHSKVSVSLNDLGVVLWEQGNYEEAHSYIRQSLAMDEALGIDDTPSFAMSLGNLGTLTANMGNMQEALKLHIREYEVLHENNPLHPGVPQSLSHIGIVLDDLEHHEAARDTLIRALELFRQIKGDDHPDVAYALNNLSSALTNLGQLDTALVYQKEALAVYEAALGTDHPNTAIQYNNLASMQRRAGDIAGAEAGYAKAVEIWRNALPQGHPHIAHGLINLGMTLMTQGRYPEALPNLEEAYQIRSALFDENSMELAHSASVYGFCLGMLGNREKADSLLVVSHQQLQRIVGDDHSFTQSALERLEDFRAKYAN